MALSALADGVARWNPWLRQWEYSDNSGYQSTTRWNPWLRQYETTDSNGNQGTAHWNPVFHQWEYGN